MCSTASTFGSSTAEGTGLVVSYCLQTLETFKNDLRGQVSRVVTT